MITQGPPYSIFPKPTDLNLFPPGSSGRRGCQLQPQETSCGGQDPDSRPFLLPILGPLDKSPLGSGDLTSKVNTAFVLDTLRKCQVSWGAGHYCVHSTLQGTLPVPLLENLSPPHVRAHKEA